MKIFVQIAAYRDPQLIPTIENMLENAKRPKNIVIGVARQFHPEDGSDDLSKYKKENKEMLSYLVFESHQEKEYIEGVKKEIEALFEIINTSSFYLIKYHRYYILYYRKQSLIATCRYLRNFSNTDMSL